MAVALALEEEAFDPDPPSSLGSFWPHDHQKVQLTLFDGFSNGASRGSALIAAKGD